MFASRLLEITPEIPASQTPAPHPVKAACLQVVHLPRRSEFRGIWAQEYAQRQSNRRPLLAAKGACSQQESLRASPGQTRTSPNCDGSPSSQPDAMPNAHRMHASEEISSESTLSFS